MLTPCAAVFFFFFVEPVQRFSPEFFVVCLFDILHATVRIKWVLQQKRQGESTRTSFSISYGCFPCFCYRVGEGKISPQLRGTYVSVGGVNLVPFPRYSTATSWQLRLKMMFCFLLLGTLRVASFLVSS